MDLTPAAWNMTVRYSMAPSLPRVPEIEMGRDWSGPIAGAIRRELVRFGDRGIVSPSSPAETILKIKVT